MLPMCLLIDTIDDETYVSSTSTMNDHAKLSNAHLTSGSRQKQAPTQGYPKDAQKRSHLAIKTTEPQEEGTDESVTKWLGFRPRLHGTIQMSDESTAKTEESKVQ
uniref:Uncharacterized protein n=1 Tax=Panagrellus redivivus TaxID=6233 RepID=A0A7E4VI86_PANRE